jgi:glycosyltransferase involved in cell wall biosynthesis
MAAPKLAIITSHPIQYYAPVFRALTQLGTVNVRVFYTWSQAGDGPTFDRDFCSAVTWDIPLLAGYGYQFVKNVSDLPGTHHFSGIKNPTLIREIEQWGAEILLVFGWFAHAHLKAMRHFKNRIPVLFRGDSTLLDQKPAWRTFLRRAFLRWVYRHIDVALAVGTNSRDYFEWCGVSPSDIFVIPHSIDTARFTADGASRQHRADEWRRELGIDAESVVLLFAGKFQEKKDPCLLLAAFVAFQARPRAFKSELLFVGNGELAGQLRALAGARTDVHFLPFQNQSVMPLIYRLADVFVLPSQGPGETWGLALNEAIACGRVVVASSNVGGARDLIKPGVDGWTFEARNLPALQQILGRAASMGRPALLQMGASAQRFSDDWSAQRCAARIAEVVSNACAGNG